MLGFPNNGLVPDGAGGGGAGDVGDFNGFDGAGASYFAKLEAALGADGVEEGSILSVDGTLYRVADDGGVLRAVRPEVYEGTSPTRQARIDGDEADFAALVANGWASDASYTLGVRGTGSITFGGTTVTFAFTAGGGGNGCKIEAQNPPDESTGYYVRARMAATGLTGSYLAGVVQRDGANDNGHARYNVVQSGAWSYWGATDFHLSDDTSSSERFIEILGEPGASGLVRIWTDGVLRHVTRRDAGATTAVQELAVICDNAFGGSGTGSLAVRDAVTWTFT